MPTAQTRVSTDRPSRYLVQLCEHLNRIDHAHSPGHEPGVRRVEWTEAHGVIDFPFGDCALHADDGGLVIELTADDPDALLRMQRMLSKRLEAIGRRENLVVKW